MRPVIGITTAHIDEELNTYPRQFYVNAIYRAGGMPILLPQLPENSPTENYLKLVDGILFSGGSDVGANHFDQEPLRGTGTVYPERDWFELELCSRALELDMPILGICRGIQIINICAGGDIFQDLYTQAPGALEHRQKIKRESPWHSIIVHEGSLLRQILDTRELRVNSFHHQAVRTIAPDFKAVAFAKDGIIEALESERHTFVLGVQWHPEAMAAVDQHAQALFVAFVEGCENT